MVELKYKPVTAEDIGDDPQERAVALGLVDKHDYGAARAVGAWRWPAIQKHEELILDRIVGRRTVDFGGNAGPVGYGSIVVDREGEIRSLGEVSGSFETIFTSHTLEHVADLRHEINGFKFKLERGGTIVAHVPSYRCVEWRADNFDGHEHTFKLRGDDTPPTYIPLDAILKYYLEIEIEVAEHVDSVHIGPSLIVIGKRS